MGSRFVGVVALALGLCLLLAEAGLADDADVRFRSTISGPAGLTAPCGVHSVESTPQIRADPRNPRRLVAVYLDRGGDGVVGARSTDGGRTWRRRPVPGATACSGAPASHEFAVNPYLDVGAGGGALFGNSYAGMDGPFFRFGVTSHAWPWGRPWSDPISLDPGADGQDAAVAFEPGSSRIAHYVWTRSDQIPNPATYLLLGDQLMTASTTDAGRTVSGPATIERSDLGYFTDNPALEMAGHAMVVAVRRPQFADLVALISGTESISLRVDVLRSEDGSSWRRTEGVATGTLTFMTHPETGSQAINGLTDFTSGPGGRLAFVDAPQPSGGRGTLELTLSRDGGRSWSVPTPTVRVPGQAILPAVAIGRHGVIGLLWTDFRNDEPGDMRWRAEVWFARSTDNGRNWKQTRVEGPMDLVRGVAPGVSYDGGPLGVTQDLVAIGNGFGAAYTVAPPLARHGNTDVRFARIAAKR